MSEKMMLENKQIVIGDQEYRLSIMKKTSRGGRFHFYQAHLSDANSQFSTERNFLSLCELEKELSEWIVKTNRMNDPELRVFESLKQWDGVVRI